MRWRRRDRDRRDRSGEDVAVDKAVAGSRALGGVPDPDAPDQNSTTGPTPTEEFVGRVAGDDIGYAGETGAEARAEADRRARIADEAGDRGGEPRQDGDPAERRGGAHRA